MRSAFSPLNFPNPLTNAPGTSQPCQDLCLKWVQVIGTGSWTLSIEGTMDNINWFTVQSGITAAGIFEAPQAMKGLRINLTAYANGTPTAILGGFEARTDE